MAAAAMTATQAPAQPALDGGKPAEGESLQAARAVVKDVEKVIIWISRGV